MRISWAVLILAGLASCGPQIVDPEVAAKRCEERARASQAPTGEITFRVNSRTGPTTSAKIGITSDFIQGLDPDQVYDRCVLEMTGAGPIRRPVLR